MSTTDEPITLETIIDKQIADGIEESLNRAARVKCDHPTERNCIDSQLRPNGKLTKGWHQADVRKMCASCACYWHLSCARNFALGVVR